MVRLSFFLIILSLLLACEGGVSKRDEHVRDDQISNRVHSGEIDLSTNTIDLLTIPSSKTPVSVTTTNSAIPQYVDDTEKPSEMNLPVVPDRIRRSARLLITNHALWAGHTATRTVTQLSLPDGELLWQTNVGCEPITLSKASPKLFATCFDTGEVVVIGEDTGEVLYRTFVGNGPFGILVVEDFVFVTLNGESMLVKLGINALDTISRVETGSRPSGMAVKDERLFVVHMSDDDVMVFDIQSLHRIGTIPIGAQSVMAETITLHRSDPRAYVPQQHQNITNMARLFDTTVFPVVTVLDTDNFARKIRETIALDSIDTPVGMPTAAVFNEQEDLLYVVNAASNDMSVVGLTQEPAAGHIVVGQNPRDLAISSSGDLAYTLNLVSDDISVIDTITLKIVNTFPLVTDERPNFVQEGERLFFTSRPAEVAKDNWMSCASCHFDGGTDGQTWLGTVGGPRNTPILRGIADTEPLHWSADRADLQAFQQTFTGLMAGDGLSDQDLDMLSQYISTLRPHSSPHRLNGEDLTFEARTGGQVFKSAGCVVCHVPPLFTDRQKHDVGTGVAFYDHPDESGKIPETMGNAFDTPSLRELWTTDPFLHDGRASTLREVLVKFNLSGDHGKTSDLSEDDLLALEMFLLSLPLSEMEVQGIFD